MSNELQTHKFEIVSSRIDEVIVGERAVSIPLWGASRLAETSGCGT